MSDKTGAPAPPDLRTDVSDLTSTSLEEPSRGTPSPYSTSGRRWRNVRRRPIWRLLHRRVPGSGNWSAKWGSY